MMKQLILYTIFLGVFLTNHAGSSAQTNTSKQPVEEARQQSVAPVLGFLKNATSAGVRFSSDFCNSEDAKNIPSFSIVIVLRKKICNAKYGSTYSTEFFEILYEGKIRLIPTSLLNTIDEEAKRFEQLDESQIEANLNYWKFRSIEIKEKELKSAIKALNDTGKHGIAILSSEIYDVSQYTQGTGFKVTVYNSTKKTIKYVTFSIDGLNAVGDRVQRDNSSAILKGIGPVEPESFATYSKDYMWFTDIVQSFRIRNIRIEYMDGTNKSISNVKHVQLSRNHAEEILFTNAD